MKTQQDLLLLRRSILTNYLQIFRTGLFTDVVSGIEDIVDGIEDIVDGIEDIVDGIEDVTFAASRCSSEK